MYNRPEDVYKVGKAKEMIEELKEQNKQPICGISSVVPMHKIKINNIEHVGTIVHICSLYKDHKKDGSLCKCICETTFFGIAHY